MITLEVSLEQFVIELKERMPKERAYLREHGGVVLLTASRAETGMILRAQSGLARAELDAKLLAAGITVEHGAWSDGALDDSTQDLGTVHVAAVGYESGERRAGVWMDAYPKEPTVQEVLNNLYDEFMENGEVAEVSFEDFLRIAQPNVVILSPDQIRYHTSNKLGG
ncbi:MAG: hypothetical protein JNM85_00390 [Chthonomonas sp.]|nr:hypothetical protein [Chthonomonas sp.]